MQLLEFLYCSETGLEFYACECNCRLSEQGKQVDESGSRRPPLKRGKVSPRLEVPKHIPRPPYVGSRNPPPFLDEFQIQDAEGIERMRASGQLAARVLEYAGTLVKVNFQPQNYNMQHFSSSYCIHASATT